MNDAVHSVNDNHGIHEPIVIIRIAFFIIRAYRFFEKPEMPHVTILDF